MIAPLEIGAAAGAVLRLIGGTVGAPGTTGDKETFGCGVSSVMGAIETGGGDGISVRGGFVGAGTAGCGVSTAGAGVKPTAGGFDDRVGAGAVVVSMLVDGGKVGGDGDSETAGNEVGTGAAGIAGEEDGVTKPGCGVAVVGG